MNTKYLKTLIIFLLLVSTASASVTREFKWNSMPYTGSFTIPESETNRTITVTLIPYPLTDFDNPGYFVKESLPSDITILSINADWHDITDRTLSLLKFSPTSSNQTISYTVRLEKEKAYDFYGIYKDENKLSGEIQTQTITVEAKPLVLSSWKPNKKDAATVITSSEEVSNTSSPSLEITAYQSPSGFQLHPFFILLFVALNCVLGYLVYKKYYKKKLPPVTEPITQHVLDPIIQTPAEIPYVPVYIEPVAEKKDQEVFTIIGDDDDDEEFKERILQEIQLLKTMKVMLLDKLKNTQGKYSRSLLLDKISDLGNEIEQLTENKQ